MALLWAIVLSVTAGPEEGQQPGGAVMLRTQACIVGAGPSGLLLAHMLHQVGVETVVLEEYSRRQILERVRAGVIDQKTMDVLGRVGFGSAMKEKAVVHRGLQLLVDREFHHLDISGLTGGRSVAIYPQQEIVRALLERREGLGLPGRGGRGACCGREVDGSGHHQRP